MKFAIVALAVVAAASAQTLSPFPSYNPGQYNPGQYNQGQYNPFNAYRKNQYRYTTPQPYRPFFSSTTPAPLVYSPSTFAPTPAPVQRVLTKVDYRDSPNAQIVKYANEINPDGSYNYEFESDNGIAAQESGVPKSLGGNPPVSPVVAQGSYRYTSPEGIPIIITYIADENGFQPSGDSIPVPPPIPAAIARSLEYIARNTKLSK